MCLLVFAVVGKKKKIHAYREREREREICWSQY